MRRDQSFDGLIESSQYGPVVLARSIANNPSALLPSLVNETPSPGKQRRTPMFIGEHDQFNRRFGDLDHQRSLAVLCLLAGRDTQTREPKLALLRIPDESGIRYDDRG
jgi:hypothetical protein